MQSEKAAQYTEFGIEEEQLMISAVLADHPDLRILWEMRTRLPGEIVINGVNPILHVYVEAVAETQIQTGDPPEAREAFERLKRAGLSDHAARGSIASLAMWYISNIMLKQEACYDAGEYARRLNMLGTTVPRKLGRNDPCLCGSGKKFKKCCEPVADLFPPRRDAGVLVLGAGRYMMGDHDMRLDPSIVELENRSWIADFLEANGEVDAAIACLEENLAFAERKGDEGYILNALQDLHFLYVDHPELGDRGLQITDRLIACSKDRPDGPLYRCDRADILAVRGLVEEAEAEYRDILASRPDYPFARYRYALLLDRLGRADEARAVVRALLERAEELDQETREAAEEFFGIGRARDGRRRGRS